MAVEIENFRAKTGSNKLNSSRHARYTSQLCNTLKIVQPITEYKRNLEVSSETL